MSPAPEIGLSEDHPDGTLPRIGEDGRQPWQVYARPFNTADKRPRIAIVIVDLGLSRNATDAAISRLPANVTLAFDSQSPVVGAWCARARQDGHETLLMVPMEPFDYPRSDPGPNTLLTNLPNSDNLQRFYNALHGATGYVGVTSLSGSRFTTSPRQAGNHPGSPASPRPDDLRCSRRTAQCGGRYGIEYACAGCGRDRTH